MDLILILLVVGFGLIGMSAGHMPPPAQDSVETLDRFEDPFDDGSDDDPRPDPDSAIDTAATDSAEAAGVEIAEAAIAAAAANASGTATTEGFEAEDQAPTGKFTTAAEVRMILDATRGNWVALREYNGQDLLYFTHLLAWRCGLHQIRFAINDGATQVFEAEPCHVDTATPNAILDDQPYLAFPPGALASVSVNLLYDDLGEDSARFERSEVLMP